MVEAAEMYRDYDLSCVPIGTDKIPTIKWGHLQKRIWNTDEYKDFKQAEGLAMVSGEVSGGLECIDFDNKGGNAWKTIKRFFADEDMKMLHNKYEFLIQQTPSGGFHVIYYYEWEGERAGNLKLAQEYQYHDGDRVFENNKPKTWTLIETRGEGGYFACYPTKGYTIRKGSFDDIPKILPEERDYIIELCRALTLVDEADRSVSGGHGKGQLPLDTDPISYFNWHKSAYVKNLLQEEGWTLDHTDKDKIEYWKRPGKKEAGHSATFNHGANNMFYVFSSNAEPFTSEIWYTPFNLLTILRFKGNWKDAENWVIEKYFQGKRHEQQQKFIRVSDDYFELFAKPDRYGFNKPVMKKRKAEMLKQQFGKHFLSSIPGFKDFTIVPDNLNYQREINEFYNLYHPFTHAPEPGDLTWTLVFLKHIFGDQYEQGLDYMKLLYEQPTQILPVLVLVSKERATGKTTFLNWLTMLFGENMVILEPVDLQGSFNHIYATKNILAVDETVIADKTSTIERIKSISTAKSMTVNEKYVSQFSIPFYGKIVMATNSEKRFMRVDQEEVRFWIRKLEKPKVENTNIEEDLAKEIPAFLHFLSQHKLKHPKAQTRMYFLPEELGNEHLNAVKEESRSWLYKELEELFTRYFDNNDHAEIKATPSDVKDRWFPNNSRVETNYIRRVLKEEFNFDYTKSVQRYLSHLGSGANQLIGRPFVINRLRFTENSPEEDGDLPF